MLPFLRPLGTPARGPRDPRGRRGATSVFVAVLLVPLIAVAALAIDLSWWQAGASELQTTADAAALSAARAAQLFPNDAANRTRQSAQTMAAQNRAFGASATIANADVIPCRYTPAATPDTVCGSPVTWTSTGANTPNAVRVVARATAPLTLGGISRTAGPAMSRRAIAWIANVNSGKCIVPFGLPYTVLYDAAARVLGSGASTANPRPDLLPAQLAALSAPGTETARTVVLRGFNAASAPPTGSGLTAYDGNWQGYGYSGNNGQNDYQEAFWTCNATVITVTVGTSGGTTLSTQGSTNQECWAARALVGSSANNCNNAQYLTDAGPNAQTCFYAAPTTDGAVTTYDASCYASQHLANTRTNPGAILRTTWSDVVGTGANALRYREIGRFLMVCYFRGAPGVGGGSGTTRERCTSGANTYTDLPIGTIVGQVQGISSMALSPGVTLGNTPSDVQRLILVK